MTKLTCACIFKGYMLRGWTSFSMLHVHLIIHIIYIIMNHNFNVSISMFCIFEGAAFFLENHGKSIFPGFQCSTAFFSQPS